MKLMSARLSNLISAPSMFDPTGKAPSFTQRQGKMRVWNDPGSLPQYCVVLDTFIQGWDLNAGAEKIRVVPGSGGYSVGFV